MARGISPTVLVGRDGELRVLRELVAGVAAGRGGVVWLEGEPGIGKSALIEVGLAAANESGCAVYRGSASELVSAVPLRALVEALRVGPGSVDALRTPLAAMLRGEGMAELVTPRDVVAILAEQVLVLVDRLCAAAPVVLVLDDMHWADEASLAVWSRLAAAAGQLPLLAVAACRPVPRRSQVQALRRELVAGGVTLMELAALSQPEVTELVARLTGARPGSRLAAAVAQAGGNPLYLRELIDALTWEERIQVEAGVAELVGVDGSPVSLPAAIGRRLDFLSEQARSLLQVAALFGPAFTVEDLAVVTGRSANDLVAPVNEAVTAGVVAEAGDQLTFRHGLIRDALYEGMPASLRAALHRQAAQALVGVGAAPERVAEQLLFAPQMPDAWVVEWVVGAAPALIYRAPQVAADLLRRARGAVPTEDARRERLDADLATALFLLGDNESVEELARPMLARTRDQTVAGRIAWTLGYALLRMGRLEQTIDVAEVVLTTPELPTLWTARLHAMQAMSLAAVGQDYDRAQATAAQAESEGLRAGDHLAVGYALHTQSMLASVYREDETASLELIDRALAALGDLPDATDLRLLLLGNRAVRLDNLARSEEADRAIAQALVLAERAGPPPRLAGLRTMAASHAYYRGRWDEALAELQASAGLPVPVNLVPTAQGVRALIAVHRAEREAAAAQLHGVDDLTLSEANDVRDHVRLLLVAWALAAERDGQPALALSRLLAIFDPDATRQFHQMRVDSYVWLPHVVRLALAAQDTDTAAAATRACAVDAAGPPTPARTASAQHCQGLVARDPAQVRRAAAGMRRAGYPLFEAQALEDAATLYAEHDDLPSARTAYLEAVDIYAELQAAWELMRADARLRPHGIRRGQRGSRGRPSTGWESLTPTEERVARLVAAGLSNPDIAAELFLSRRTVETHVGHVLAKLDLRSRVGIAREATSR